MSIVSRLVGHKGTDLVVQALDGIVECGCQLLVLGQGETHYENAFREAQARWPGRVSAQITYSDDLARRVYAGSDLLLMPSRSEPCGLSQMIAMRYGTVPIVRSTGGLRDTVLPPESARAAGSCLSSTTRTISCARCGGRRRCCGRRRTNSPRCAAAA